MGKMGAADREEDSRKRKNGYMLGISRKKRRRRIQSRGTQSRLSRGEKSIHRKIFSESRNKNRQPFSKSMPMKGIKRATSGARTGKEAKAKCRGGNRRILSKDSAKVTPPATLLRGLDKKSCEAKTHQKFPFRKNGKKTKNGR